MNSNILNSIGLGSIDPAIFIIILLVLLLVNIVLLVIFIVKNVKLTNRMNAFMLGKDASSLEEEITDLFAINKNIVEKVRENRKDIRKIYRKFTKAIQKVGIVKYDAYQQMGGDLSFSMALLDEENNGFIMNSVHSTEGCYTYTKEVRDGRCDLELGNEERIALEKAVNQEQ
ncbi:MAG: DUF4446 family protein [Lachnospiraceae bacterium]|nr:DUF4446 family protein [Lachnospiraceae bacterium]MDY4999968.1 DUF4446 family protein [Lachnospiraceae bacterium]